LRDDIEAKQKSLSFAISNEVLEQTLRIQRKQDELKKLQSIGLKKPLEYYEDAKHLINDKKWLDAKTELLKYRNLVTQGTPVTKTTGDGGVRSPQTDSHLKYLAYVEDQLNQQEQNTILSCAGPNVVTMKKKNEYEPLWDKWQADYMGKK